MGYTAEQAKQALRVAAGDLEQAVGFLLMGDQSQAQLAETLGSSFAQAPSAMPTQASGRGNNNIDTMLSPTPANNRRLNNDVSGLGSHEYGSSVAST